jgi:beta-lactam-binding protein with PASTA domain
VQPSRGAAPVNNAPLPQPDHREIPHPSGTVVLDVASGQVVPEFLGKPLRVAVQLAQQSGVELQVIGSGVAREQSPPPGTRVPAGSKVAVRFTR